MKAAILAGGFGTRMPAGTSKILVEVAGRPFLAHVLDSVLSAGHEVVLCLGGPFEDDTYDEFYQWPIQFSYESWPLGTGGAVKNALQLLGEEFLVLNGDTWFRVPTTAFPQMMFLARGRGNVWARRGLVTDYVKGTTRGRYLDLGGCYSRKLFDDTPEAFDMEVIVRRAIQHGLSALEIPGPYYEVGSPEGLAHARKEFPR